MQLFFIVIISSYLTAVTSPAFSAMNHGGMNMDISGMIMNANADRLPKDCPKISKEIDLTVHAGREHAQTFNGKMFAYDQQEWDVPACAKLNITFINDDHVRHQFMIHGLPGYLYPKGMFTIELNGHGSKKASLIVSTKPQTYLVHCDISQHTSKGMKAQLKVAGGNGDLPSIPGITAPVKMDLYIVAWNAFTWLLLLTSVMVGISLPLYLLRSIIREKSA